MNNLTKLTPDRLKLSLRQVYYGYRAVKEPMSEVDCFLPECRLCQFYSCNIHLRCAVHPSGVESEHCLDFMPYKPSSLPPAIEVYPPEKLKQQKKSV